MKKHIIFFLFLLITCTHVGQSFKLSPEAEISIITCGTGDELYSTFGHSAFRVKDPKYHVDIVYNYGTFNFNTPNFYLKFAQGKLLYELERSRFDRFLDIYIRENRWVKEQVLNLNYEEKDALFKYLQWNAKPENSAYKYDFFFNNCATKIRDVYETALPNTIAFTDEHVKTSMTFRELIQVHLDYNSWGSFGIDLALGAVIDREATAQEFLFLPEYVLKSFDNASKKNGETVVKTTNTLLEEKSIPNTNKNFFTSPLFFVLIASISIMLITVRDHQRKKKSAWLDVTLFIFTGIIGLLLLLLWFATDHTATANNFNILWAFPPNLLFAFLSLPSWRKRYLKFLLFLLLVLVVLWIFKIQVFPVVLTPLLVALATRYFYLIKN